MPQDAIDKARSKFHTAACDTFVNNPAVLSTIAVMIALLFITQLCSFTMSLSFLVHDICSLSSFDADLCNIDADYLISDPDFDYILS